MAVARVKTGNSRLSSRENRSELKLFLRLGRPSANDINGLEQNIGVALTLLHIIVLALVQGITEFLPISSSGHLILVPALTGWRDQGLVIDIAVHVGTLAAVMIYFRREFWSLARGFLSLFLGRWDAEARLALNILIATPPVILAGLVLRDYVEVHLRSVAVIGWTTLGFGLLLYAADRLGLRIRRVEHMTAGGAVIIGLFQMLAPVPGVSRAGVTMTAARFLGYERVEAARFSLLLSMPVIIGAGTVAGFELYGAGDVSLGFDALLAVLLAFIFALIAIALMMRWLRRASFTPFVIYRVCLGAGLLIWSYGLWAWFYELLVWFHA